LRDEAEVDSVDSIICAYESPMLMRFFHAHARGSLGERQALQIQEDDLENIAYIQDDRERKANEEPEVEE